METDDTTVGGSTLLDSASAEAPTDAPEPLAVPPPVVAVMVTHNPGPWLEDALAGLRDQDYPDLTVLVLDAGSDEDPTGRVAAVLPAAYVRTIGPVGFAAAANEALGAVEGATFLLVCHDDVDLDPSGVRLLVEEAFRSNAAVLGPKLVAAQNPDVLLEVGLAIDRFGVPFSYIEPGEIDQEQHDGVRDVFYVSSAAMLVRADLFTELRGFDPATSPGGEDLDLCWRARLLGARVLVVPDARAAHRRAGGEKPTSEQPAVGAVDRNRLRAVLKAYSFPTLLWTVPLGFVLASLEGLAFLLTGRVRRARALLGAWVDNVRHLGELRRSRQPVQRTRTVRDSELRYLQVRGSARFTTYVSRRLHAEDRLQTLSVASRDLVGVATRRARRPMALGLLAFAVCYVIGSRTILFGRVPSVGTFLPWPSIGNLGATFGSGWRYSGLGHGVPASGAFALMSMLGTVLFGKVGLAQTIVVVGALPLGAYGVFRLTRSISPSPLPASSAALAYAVSPVVRNDLATGRLGPLVLFGLAPFLFSLLTRAVGTFGGEADDSRPAWPARRIVGLAVLMAIATACFPSALPLVLAMAVSLLFAALFVGRFGLAWRAVVTAAIAGALATVLLLPWPLTLLGPGDRTAIGWVFRPNLDLSEILRFHTGPAGGGWSSWALLGAAALPLLVGTGPRFVWACRAWMLALVGYALVWAPQRWASHWAVPPPEGALTLAALGLALAIGLGVGVFIDDLRRLRFGWRQFVSVAAVVALALPALGFVADIGSGRWRAPAHDWVQELAFTRGVRNEGTFRVLWLGDAAVLPVDAVTRPDGVGYGLTRNGPGDARDLWPTPIRGADALLAESVDLATSARTNRLGHLLAPMAVRYIAVPDRRGPDASAVADVSQLLAVLADQLDLARLETTPGLVLYENRAWVPGGAIVTGAGAVTLPRDSKDPKKAALRDEPGSAAPVPLPGVTSAPVPAGTLLWSEAFSRRWSASSSGRRLEHVKLFGWSNGYVVAKPGRVSLHDTGQSLRNVVVALEGLGWLAVLGFLVVTRPRRREDWSTSDGAHV